MVNPQSTHDICSMFCCNVNFLAFTDTGRIWAASPRGSALLSMALAHELGRRTNAGFFAPDLHPTAEDTP